MKKNIFANSIIYLLCMVVACLLNLAVSGLITYIVLSFADIGYFATAILRIVIGFLVGALVLGAVVGFESYKKVEFLPLPTVLSIVIAGVPHLLLSIFFMFHPFIAGGVRYLAGWIEFGTDFFSDQQFADVYLWTYLLAFFIYLVFQIVMVLVCGFMGKRIREKGRDSIEGYSESNE